MQSHVSYQKQDVASSMAGEIGEGWYVMEWVRISALFWLEKKYIKEPYESVYQFPLLATKPTARWAAVFAEAKVLSSIPSAVCKQ